MVTPPPPAPPPSTLPLHPLFLLLGCPVIVLIPSLFHDFRYSPSICKLRAGLIGAIPVLSPFDSARASRLSVLQPPDERELSWELCHRFETYPHPRTFDNARRPTLPCNSFAIKVPGTLSHSKF